MNETVPRGNNSRRSNQTPVIIIVLGIFGGLMMLHGTISAIVRPPAATVKGNMLTTQFAVEKYAIATGGKYPVHLRNAMSCFPDAGKALCTEALDLGTLSQERATVWFDGKPSCSLKPLQIIYFRLDSGNDYAVLGTDERGCLIRNVVGKPLVFSRHHRNLRDCDNGIGR
jgi:hypothetical protein